jgi:porphobilinogen deaminase
MKTTMKLRLASRGSTLALWQAHHVQTALHVLHEGLEVDVEVLHTTGDIITDVPLSMIGDKGLFTKEVDAAVLDGRTHAAVHSFKDVPTKLPDGLTLAAVLEREDFRDAFLPAPGVHRHCMPCLPARASAPVRCDAAPSCSMRDRTCWSRTCAATSTHGSASSRKAITTASSWPWPA